jgi:two-component system, cell cycle sensor histidine kinase and response regulator CckA
MSPSELAADVLDHLLEGCQVIGFDFTYVYVNEAAATQGRRACGELVGRPMVECYPGIDATPMFELLRRCMSERTHHRMDNEFTFPDGTVGWFELRFEPVPQGVCILSLDITEAKKREAELARTEHQLRHAQKMEAVGRLAGGVAHDFNNLLSVVLSYSEMLLSDGPVDERVRGDLLEIRDAGVRGAELTRQLLAFSRQQVLEVRVLNLNEVVDGVRKMLRKLLGADVELTVSAKSGLWPVRVDAGQIEQIVMNLAVNARDALPRGGKLTIETSNVHLDEDYAAAHEGVTAGDYAMLAITDNGIGMDRETQSRIFEPFFTTKERGKGTGLGLATVFGIVKQSGGHIWVYSEPAHGTTFKLYFPRAEGEVVVTSSDRPVAESENGEETILLVDDDDHVRGVARQILTRAGYTVLEASNAGEAMIVAEQHRAEIDLLVTDVVLPRISGRELAQRLALQRPKMRVLFMSGYTDDTVLRHGILEGGMAYLQKPLTPRSLTQRVRVVLSQP